MTHPRSRPARSGAETGMPAKHLRWRLLDDLCAARTAFGLKDRSLQVLRALLTFLPKRPDPAPCGYVVFPSNRTLSERLMGMPEATLRRHLRLLCDAGLVARRDSPNRKRYRVGRSVVLSFGFDLAPFFRAGAELRRLATEAEAERADLRALRADVLDRLAHLPPDDPRQAETRRALRRKLDRTALTALRDALPECADAGRPTPETSATDGGNERHIHPETQNPNHATEIARLAVAEVAEIAGTELRDARDVERAGERVSTTLGVAGAWGFARMRKGPVWATMALAHLLRRAERVRDPDRYLHALTRRAMAGEFDLLEALGMDRGGAGGRAVACRQRAAGAPAPT